MSGLVLERLGPLMAPEPGNPLEVEGVLNPAAVRGQRHQLETDGVGQRHGVRRRRQAGKRQR